MKAMLLAAGLGTRLKPFTDYHPKALAVVNGKTLLQRNIEYLKDAGVNSIIINVHHFADQIIQFLDANHSFDIAIEISDERDQVLETGGALLKAKWYFENENSPFILMNADILTNLSLSDMIQHHKQHKPLATIAVSKRISSRHFLFNAQQQLCGWENINKNEVVYSRSETSLHALAFSGIHIIEPLIFSLITQQGKFSMVDMYLDLAATQSILGYDHTGTLLIDAGKPESLVAAEKLFF